MSPAPWKGQQKVAALLLSLDPEMAAGLLTQFDENDIAEVGSAMATIDPSMLTEENIGSLHKDFVDSMIADTGPEGGGMPPINDMLEDLLGMALSPEKAKQVRNKIEVAARKNRPFLFLEKLKLETLRKVLEGEHPQIVALVCAKMSPDTTALVLAGMAEEERNDVVRRMAALDIVKPDLVKEVITALEAKASALKPAAPAAGAAVEEEEAPDPTRRIKAVVDILKSGEQEVEKSILKALDEKDPELAKTIRELMFTFEDLATLDKKAMQKILMGVETRLVAIALKAADGAVEANFVSNMSKRVQAMLQEEREMMGDVTVEEITNAQKEIMNSVRAMIESGEIQIPRKGGAGAKPQ